MNERSSKPAPLLIHGQTVFAQPLFLAQLEVIEVIVLAWVNDEDTKRAYESEDDAYRVFRKMLASGHPPDDWDQLLKEATPAANRLQSSMASLKGLE